MEFQRYRLNQRVIDDLKKRSTVGILFYVLAAVIVFYSHDYYLRHPRFSLVFIASILGICLFRGIHLIIAHRALEEKKAFHTSVFISSVVGTALIWGIGFSFFMLKPGEYASKLLMSICIAGLTAGGVTAFMPERRLAHCFNMLMLLPGSLLMLIYNLNTPLAFLLAMFSVYMVFMAHRGNSEYWDALENEFLLEIKSRQLEALSNTDGLTGIKNRRYFDAMFEKEWKRSSRDKSPLTLMICDIDHFKMINDTHGHLAGDDYLKAIAGLLESTFQRDNDIVARYGGEEFVVLLPGIGSRDASNLAEKFRKAVAATPVDYHGVTLNTTVSIGTITVSPEHQANREAIILKADKALYQAKSRGRNQVRTGE